MLYIWYESYGGEFKCSLEFEPMNFEGKEFCNECCLMIPPATWECD